MMTCVWRTKRFVLLYSTRAPLSLASSVKCLAFCSCRSTLYSTQPQMLLLLPISGTIFIRLFIYFNNTCNSQVNTPKVKETKRRCVCVCSQNQLFIVRQAIGIVCNCMHGNIVRKNPSERVQSTFVCWFAHSLPRQLFWTCFILCAPNTCRQPQTKEKKANKQTNQKPSRNKTKKEKGLLFSVWIFTVAMNITKVARIWQYILLFVCVSLACICCFFFPFAVCFVVRGFFFICY